MDLQTAIWDFFDWFLGHPRVLLGLTWGVLQGGRIRLAIEVVAGDRSQRRRLEFEVHVRISHVAQAPSVWGLVRYEVFLKLFIIFLKNYFRNFCEKIFERLFIMEFWRKKNLWKIGEIKKNWENYEKLKKLGILISLDKSFEVTTEFTI